MTREQIISILDGWWVQASAIMTLATLWVARMKSVRLNLIKFAQGVKFYLCFPFVLDKKLNENSQNLNKRLEDQDKKLSVIEKEVTPNGGGSIKDMVKNISDLALIANLRTKQIIASHPIAIYECDPIDGKCITANSVLCELFGLTESQMMGAGWLSALAPDDRQECWIAYQTAIKSDIPYEWNYTVVNHKTREKYKCRTEMVVLRDQKGRPILYQGVVEKLNETV